MQYFCVTVPSAVRLTLFTTDGYGIFNMLTNLGECRTHEDGDQAQSSELVNGVGFLVLFF